MNRLEKAIKYMEDAELSLVLLGSDEEQMDFGDAFVGVIDDSIAVYERDKVIEVFMNRDGMSDIEAVEWFDYNVQGAYIGEQTPLYIQTDF